MTTHTPAQPMLTDDEILRTAINSSDSLNITRVHEIGGPSRTIMEDAGLLELGRAIESALLSKLRAPVADERALSVALRAIAEYPTPGEGSMSAANMREIARAALASAPVAGEPVAWVAADTLNSPHPKCISSLAYMSQIDQKRGREYVPLAIIDRYAAPVAAQPAVNGYTCTVPDDCETLHWRGQILSMNELAAQKAGDGDVRDAARYRWLRGHFRFAADSDCEIWFDISLKNSPADQLDAAIDAAMQQQSQENGNG